MRWRGVHHVEFSVLEYEKSVEFYDKMFGWLGYSSFWTLDVGYRSTYYVARMPSPHSYIGIQPAKTGGKLSHADRATGIHHIALWAKNRREVDAFHAEFLAPNGIEVSDPPQEYAVYAPGYYAVFFEDPINGIHWELAHTPRIPSIGAYLKWKRALDEERKNHPEWGKSVVSAALRKLPKR